MLGHRSDHRCWVFRALRFVDRRCIGGYGRIEFAERIFDLAAIELLNQYAFGVVNASNRAEIAIEHISIIVILDLHHFVANGKGRPEFLDLWLAAWIENPCSSMFSELAPNPPRFMF